MTGIGAEASELADRPDWSGALCREYPPDLAMQIWFCEWDTSLASTRRATGPERSRIAYAAAICHRCPVRRECLDYSLVHRIKFGVWGGVGQHDRRKMMHVRQTRRGDHPADTRG